MFFMQVALLTVCFIVAASADGNFSTSVSETRNGNNGWGKKESWKKKKRSKARSLQILHSSDNESSFQDPNSFEEKILGYSAVINGLMEVADLDNIPTVHVLGGDITIPGPFYEASVELERYGQPGVADIKMFNKMHVDGNGLGNHELDGGIDEFAFMLRAARFPFITANVDFSGVVLQPDTPSIRVGNDGLECNYSKKKIVKSCYVSTKAGRIGLIGRAPADLFNVVEDPDTNLPGLDFFGGRDPDTNQPLVSAVGQVLEQVDLLTQKSGVDIIILLDHAQDFTGDPLESEMLYGIDVIVTAGSTGFFAESQAFGPYNLLREGDEPDQPYPLLQQDANGDYILVINTDELYRYVGHLILDFDDDGRLISWSGGRSGSVATLQSSIDLFEDIIGEVPKPSRGVKKIFEQLKQTPSIQEGFTVVGVTNFPLNGLRADVRSRETNLARLVADSTLWAGNNFATDNGLPAIDVALKNGGGIRDSIVGPNIVKLTVQASLAFNNQLAIVELTGKQMLAAMENAVSRVPATDGRFPHVAGIELEFDSSQPGLEGLDSVTTPSRVKSLVITKADGSVDTLVNGFMAIDLSGTYVMATNSFLLTGGDGYTALQAGNELGLTVNGEQQILIDYINDVLGGEVLIDDPPPGSPRVAGA